MSSPNTTSGLRLSGWYTSERNVVTWHSTSFTIALTVPNRAPTSTTPWPIGRSSASMASGRASVAKSRSCSPRGAPSSASRNGPPTR